MTMIHEPSNMDKATGGIRRKSTLNCNLLTESAILISLYAVDEFASVLTFRAPFNAGLEITLRKPW